VDAVRRIVLESDSASPNTCIDGLPLLGLAARHGKASVIQLLLDADADPTLGTRFKETPLHLAAEHGHADACRALLQDPRCAVDAQDETGRTPLFLAAFRGHRLVCQLLLDAHADWRIHTTDGHSVLAAAATIKLGVSHCDNILTDFEAMVRKEEEARIAHLAEFLCQPPLCVPALPAAQILRQCREPSHLSRHGVFATDERVVSLCESASLLL
jgi:hypothetical protein